MWPRTAMAFHVSCQMWGGPGLWVPASDRGSPTGSAEFMTQEECVTWLKKVKLAGITELGVSTAQWEVDGIDSAPPHRMSEKEFTAFMYRPELRMSDGTYGMTGSGTCDDWRKYLTVAHARCNSDDPGAPLACSNMEDYQQDANTACGVANAQPIVVAPAASRALPRGGIVSKLSPNTASRTRVPGAKATEAGEFTPRPSAERCIQFVLQTGLSRAGSHRVFSPKNTCSFPVEFNWHRDDSGIANWATETIQPGQVASSSGLILVDAKIRYHACRSGEAQIVQGTTYQIRCGVITEGQSRRETSGGGLR